MTGEIAAGLPAELPLPLRLLLGSAGTFVDLLETCAGEPVAVRRLSEQTFALKEPVIALDAPAGTEVLDRRVLLLTAASGEILVDAQSILIPGRLPVAVIDDLTTTNAPLGRILVQRHVLILRRHVGAWVEHPAQDSIWCDSADTLVCREYVIEVEAGPAVLITERLPQRGPWNPPVPSAGPS
jgi:chorismate-pyruvate lyase